MKGERGAVESFETSKNIHYTSIGMTNELKTRIVGRKEIPISVGEAQCDLIFYSASIAGFGWGDRVESKNYNHTRPK